MASVVGFSFAGFCIDAVSQCCLTVETSRGAESVQFGSQPQRRQRFLPCQPTHSDRGGTQRGLSLRIASPRWRLTVTGVSSNSSAISGSSIPSSTRRMTASCRGVRMRGPNTQDLICSGIHPSSFVDSALFRISCEPNASHRRLRPLVHPQLEHIGPRVVPDHEEAPFERDVPERGLPAVARVGGCGQERMIMWPSRGP